MAYGLYTVFGGSGFLGRHVVQRLAAQGHRVRVAVRRPDLAAFLKPLGHVGQIQIVTVNVRDPESVARAVAGATGVVNLVGILSESGQQKFEKVHVDGAANVARAAAAAGCRSLVHVSAIGADAASEVGYARTKALGEARVREAFPQATILRPSVMFGPEDTFLNRFAGLIKMLPFVPVICGATRFQPVYVGDVAEAAVRSLLDPARYGGRTFELGGPAVRTMREILAYVRQEIMSKKELVTIPDALARIQAAVLGLLPRAPLTTDQLRMLQRDNVAAPGSEGLDAFGIEPTPMEAIAPRYLVLYRPKGSFSRPIDTLPSRG
ncbi:complex I NDUFA9 subunit family protein [Pedomonas sp. V897]|uniref:complex I NDUFA9 subunit family protein n=1 Tax=Pedomonas sp. V897 TaxID=3446482 RepID=UPI003EE341F2